MEELDKGQLKILERFWCDEYEEDELK